MFYCVLLCFTGKSGKQITEHIGDGGGYYGPRPYRPPGGRWSIIYLLIYLLYTHPYEITIGKHQVTFSDCFNTEGCIISRIYGPEDVGNDP